MTTHILNPALIVSVHADDHGDLVIVEGGNIGAPAERARGLAYLVEALNRLRMAS